LNKNSNDREGAEKALKKLFFVIFSLSVLFIISGCTDESSQLNEIQSIAFNSLSDKEKDEIIDINEEAEIKKIDEFPNNASIYFGEYDAESLYSVTFRSNNHALGDLIVFVDNLNKKSVGVSIRR